MSDSPRILTLDVTEGMDRFNCSGDETTVLRLYGEWLEKIKAAHQEAADFFARTTLANRAADALAEVGVDTRRLQ